MYKEEYKDLELDQREDHQTIEWDEDDESVEVSITKEDDTKEKLSQIRDSAAFAITFFDKGRISDAIADLVFIRANAEKLLLNR